MDCTVLRVPSFPLKLDPWANEKIEIYLFPSQLHEAHVMFVYRSPKVGVV